MTKETIKLALKALKNAIAVRNGEEGTMLCYPLEENAITALEALAKQPAQRKLLGIEELEALWNSQANNMNQWDELGLDEIVSFAQSVHNIKENI